MKRELIMEAIIKQYFQSDLALRQDVVRQILMRVPDMDLLDLAQGFMINVNEVLAVRS